MTDEQKKKALIQRLKRIEGQVRGIQHMLEEDRECREIAQQLQAVQSAVHSANRELIQTHLAECIANADFPKGKLDEITKLFTYLD